MGAHVGLCQTRANPETSPSFAFVRGWAQRQEEMKRASCAVECTVSLILSFLHLLRFAHEGGGGVEGKTHKRFQIVPLSFASFPNPP